MVDGPWRINKGSFLVCKTIGNPKEVKKEVWGLLLLTLELRAEIFFP